jgi:predicted nucleic acid-binding protein
VEKAVRESSQVATAMVSYAEARATFARLLREESLNQEEHEGIVEALDERWKTYEKPAVTENLLRLAGEFAQRYALRGYDAVQLASAFVCHGAHRDVRFLSFDDKLNEAARQVMPIYQEAEMHDADSFRLWVEQAAEEVKAPEQDPKSLLEQLQPAGRQAFHSKYAQLPFYLFDTPTTDEWDMAGTLEKGVMLATTLYSSAIDVAGHENVEVHVEAQDEDTFLVFGTFPGAEGHRVTFLEESMSFLALTCESEEDLETLFQKIMSQIDPS